MDVVHAMLEASLVLGGGESNVIEGGHYCEVLMQGELFVTRYESMISRRNPRLLVQNRARGAGHVEGNFPV